MIAVRKVSAGSGLEEALAIRYEVFVKEQDCPPELEIEADEEAQHFLAAIDHVPAGAARWRKTANGYKLERFAVLKMFRGTGVGKALMKTLLSDIPQDNSCIYLNAQVQAISFYEDLGFSVQGESFEEAGILHCKMVKEK
jgi:predicted GNAT family N-acyltransferase